MLRTITGSLDVSLNELNLKPCLRGGMSFRWSISKEKNDEIEYTGIIRDKIFILNQIRSKNVINYTAFFKSDYIINTCELEFKNKIYDELYDYFRLKENLNELYNQWSERDPHFKERITKHETLCGIRSLRLDPVENLFSFICSSNNNIKRITQMVENMSKEFGSLIGNLNNIDYYSFPTIDRLSQSDVEDKLRNLKFGYRAKYIHQAAVYLKKKENYLDWLYSLRTKEYDEVIKELVMIPGIGRKVADCIALMSLDKLNAIPVDTHVLQIATNLYKFKNDNKTLTDKSYRDIANRFRELWGEHAGWAQTIMFIDDLRQFKNQKSESSLPDLKNDPKPKAESMKRSKSTSDQLKSKPSNNNKKSKLSI